MTTKQGVESPPNTLAIDVGGSNVKMMLAGCEERRSFPSGPTLTPERMVAGVRELTADWSYRRVSLGIPTPIVAEQPVIEPKNLGAGWLTFDFPGAFACPTKVVNDAAMQALGSYDGGHMLFIGLGTGMGSAMVADGVVMPMELSDLPYRNGKTFEEWVCRASLDELGKKRWRTIVLDVIQLLRTCLCADYVALGGGNAKKLNEIPSYARACPNSNAFIGGFRLWDPDYQSSQADGEP